MAEHFPPPVPFLEGGIRLRGVTKQKSTDRPLFSIITVVHNGEKHLEQAILSGLRQTYDNVEYIIVDGGSTDGTLPVIRKYEDRIDYWVSEPDRGIYDAMNKGIALASGELIGFLNSDDWYTPHALEEVVKAYKQHPDRKVAILGKWNAVFEDIGKTLTLQPSLKFYRLRICHQAMFVPKSIYEMVGPYDTSYKLSADLEMAVRLSMRKIEFVFLNETVVSFRTGGASGRKFHETGKEQSIIIKKYFPLTTYLMFQILRMKFEVFSFCSILITKILGEKAAGEIKKWYFRLFYSRFTERW